MINEQNPSAAQGDTAAAGGQQGTQDQAAGAAAAAQATGEGGKPQGDQAGAQALPLALPKDSPLDPARIEKVAALAKERNLPADVAQAILTAEHEAVSDYHSAQAEKLTKEVESWEKACLADPEIGGDKLPETTELAKRAQERFTTPALKEQLAVSGLAKHPEVLKMFAKIGRAMAPDSPAKGGKGGETGSPADRFYKP
jgi:hypothetical protein